VKVIRRLLLSIPLFASVVLIAHGSAFAGQAINPLALNPPANAPYTCMATGSGAICRYTIVDSHTGQPSGTICPGGFELLDTATNKKSAVRYYDANGDLTRRVIYENYTVAEVVNSVTGAYIPYTQHDTITDIPAVPGDLSTATETNTGENMMTAPGLGHVWQYAGTFVTAPDGTVEFSAGPNNFLYDWSGLNQRVCAALS
jgi:hypothetical protein